MRRLAGLFGAILLVAALGAPAALAADESLPQSGRVLIAIEGDVSVPAGDQADVVLVVNGDAEIGGTVNALAVINGTARLTGATVESILVVSGTVDLAAGTTVLGDVRSVESTVTQAEGVEVTGEIKGLDAELFAFGAFLVPAMMLFALGVFLATLLAAVALAAVGARQVRAAERLITTEPVPVFVIGLVAAIGLPILAIVAIVTIVGAPLGLGILFGALPALALLGYLVIGIFIGDQLLGTAKEPAVARPYRAAIAGIVVLQLIALVPFLGGLVTAVASMLGVGAVLLLAWRTIRGTTTGAGETAAPQPAPAPIGA